MNEEVKDLFETLSDCDDDLPDEYSDLFDEAYDVWIFSMTDL